MMTPMGVDVNRFIQVLDAGLNPIASDIKVVLQMQASRGKPHFGLTVDVKGDSPFSRHPS